MTIETGKQFCCQKLISLRTMGTQAEISTAVKRLCNYLKSKAINRAGPTITGIFSVDHKGGDTILDMEILIPIDRLFAPEYGYIFKSKFQLTNAAHICYKGKPEMLQDACNEIIRHIQELEHQDITTLYKVMTAEPIMINGKPGDIIVDLYIDVNPAI